jgi:hypothetical protein
MMVEICWVYTLSMGARPDMGWVTNETEYRNMAIDPRRITTKETMTKAHTRASISSAVIRLAIIFSPVLV